MHFLIVNIVVGVIFQLLGKNIQFSIFRVMTSEVVLFRLGMSEEYWIWMPEAKFTNMLYQQFPCFIYEFSNFLPNTAYLTEWIYVDLSKLGQIWNYK